MYQPVPCNAGGEEVARAATVLRACLRPATAKASPDVAVACAHLLGTAAQHHPSLLDLLCFPTSLAAEHPPGKVSPSPTGLRLLECCVVGPVRSWHRCAEYSGTRRMQLSVLAQTVSLPLCWVLMGDACILASKCLATTSKQSSSSIMLSPTFAALQENEGKAAPLLLLSEKAASRAPAKPYGCLDGLAELLAGAQQLHTDSPRLLAAATGAVVSFCQVQHGLKFEIVQDRPCLLCVFPLPAAI